MNDSDVKLGYIGLGNMGAPMAKRMVDWPGGLTVFDIRTEAMTPLAEAGARLADRVSDLAAADIISVTVLNDEQVREVVGELAGLGKPDTVMTGGFNKQVFSTFTGRATQIEPTKQKKIIASVDAYESDFGVLKITPNRFQRARDVLVLWMEMWALAFLNGRRMVSVPLAKTGDSDRRMLLSEYALVARNEKGSGGVFDNTTS